MGEVVILVPLLKFFEPVIKPVIEPSVFCRQRSNVGTPAGAVFLTAFLTGAFFATGTDFILSATGKRLRVPGRFGITGSFLAFFAVPAPDPPNKLNVPDRFGIWGSGFFSSVFLAVPKMLNVAARSGGALVFASPFPKKRFNVPGRSATASGVRGSAFDAFVGVIGVRSAVEAKKLKAGLGAGGVIGGRRTGDGFGGAGELLLKKENGPGDGCTGAGAGAGVSFLAAGTGALKKENGEAGAGEAFLATTGAGAGA